MVTTVMLKAEEEQVLNRARETLLFMGLNALDEELKKVAQSIPLEKLTKGAVVALAAAILIHELEKNNR